MKALVVDDDVVSRMALVDLLQSFNRIEVVEAVDGEDAWAQLRAGLTPILCCCDMQMPRLNGMGLLKRVRQSPYLKDLPFVLVTSVAEVGVVREAIDLGTTHYIVKPFNAHEARTHLGKIYSGACERLAEHPSLTLRRLNIGPDRLEAYFSLFQKQLQECIASVAAASAEEPVAPPAQLESLYTGCITLGLWYAARLLDRVRGQAASSGQLLRALTDAQAAVTDQARKAKASVLIR